jgi:hypothetical protein
MYSRLIQPIKEKSFFSFRPSWHRENDVDVEDIPQRHPNRPPGIPIVHLPPGGSPIVGGMDPFWTRGPGGY